MLDRFNNEEEEGEEDVYAWGGTHDNIHSVSGGGGGGDLSYQNSGGQKPSRNILNYGGYRLDDADSLVASNTRL